jgi:hypothetical protein
MNKKKKKIPHATCDPFCVTFTGDATVEEKKPAVALARPGGLKGGKAKESAQKATQKRRLKK